MFVLRCTRKLIQKIAPTVRLDAGVPRSTARLGDWYANALVIRREHLVLAVSETTLLPVLVSAAPYRTLAERLPDAVGEMLAALGIDDTKVAAEVAAMGECVVAPTSSRQVVGAMTEFGKMLDDYFDGRPIIDVALHLAQTPCGPLKGGSPDDATKALFKRPLLRLVED